jgi:hypothetical protein
LPFVDAQIVRAQLVGVLGQDRVSELRSTEKG